MPMRKPGSMDVFADRMKNALREGDDRDCESDQKEHFVNRNAQSNSQSDQ
jgi:hypothetical protein